MPSLLIEIVAGACLLGGVAFLVVGAIGLVRLPDFFTRIHATGIIDTMGIALTFAGLVLLAGWSLPAVKLVLILCFMLLTGPTATHALAKAALHGRLDPLSGRPPESPSSNT
jgi:multicomponent Na+:H+ antiporter subunit G